ncbi:GAD-like domain-containing protein [Pseudomonas alabamensis]|uniref:GAD-like domain-containing protein n=1 Tax=Pseudomonas alabamensis TaxID=3064349 RepID=UPI003F64B804
MDKVYVRFIEKLGQPISYQRAPEASIKRYEGKLPKKLLEYWAEHGWCGYGKGIFWLVDPHAYETVVNAWLEPTSFQHTDTYHVIGRSAFGDLYLWGEKTGFSLKIISVLSQCVVNDFVPTPEQMDRKLQDFLLSLDRESNDYASLFDAAQKKLGTLKHDEMYGFVPALMLGGSSALEHLEKVKAVEHLVFLSQLAALRPMAF